MGVYNLSMKMPENCYLCGYSVCGCVTSNMILQCGVAEPMDFMEAQEHRHKDCPLVEVKAPHGRLIDADALRARMYHEAFETDSDMQKWESGCWIRYKMFEQIEEAAPTVLETEG